MKNNNNNNSGSQTKKRKIKKQIYLFQRWLYDSHPWFSARRKVWACRYHVTFSKVNAINHYYKLIWERNFFLPLSLFLLINLPPTYLGKCRKTDSMKFLFFVYLLLFVCLFCAAWIFVQKRNEYRDVWPQSECFGSSDAAPEDELLLLRDIFITNLNSGKCC